MQVCCCHVSDVGPDLTWESQQHLGNRGIRRSNRDGVIDYGRPPIIGRNLSIHVHGTSVRIATRSILGADIELEKGPD